MYKNILSSLAAAALFLAYPVRRQETQFAGYLLSTFSDPTPEVQQYISTADSPLAFTAINNGNPVLASTVGTGGVRDIFLTTNSARSEYFIIATDLDINADGFNWDWATRQGSRGLVVWSSTNLVDWSEPALRMQDTLNYHDIVLMRGSIEQDTAGMAWAPSVVWDDVEQQYYVFWASRQYDPSDTEHSGVATQDYIRYATTTDFVNFSSPSDYVSDPNIGLIDQEFQYLGTPGSYVRFLKDETQLRVYQERTSDGIFGTWTRNDGFTVEGSPLEGPASFADINNPGTYYLLLDNYTEYVPYVTTDILSGSWTSAGGGFPRGIKHGSVFPITQAELDAITAAFS